MKLGNLIDVKHGFAFSSEYFRPVGPHILLTPGNFYEAGGFKAKSDQKHYDGPLPEAFILNPRDLLVAMTEQGEGLLGSAAFVPEGKPCLHNQRLGLVTAKEGAEVDLTYIYYVLNWLDVRQQIRATATGAKIRHTSPSRIAAVEIPDHPLDTQSRIAAILGAYDDLIEVNRRRVAVLEEMARGMFEEWFVRFRFPGHETVPLVDTPDGRLPLGWSFISLGSQLSLHYGKALKSTDRREGDVAVLGSSGVVGSHDLAYVKRPGVVLGRKGNVGSVIWSPVPFWPIDTTYFVETGLPEVYVLELLRRIPFQNTDAAVPGLNRDYALSRMVVAPSIDLVSRYGTAMTPMRRQIDLLIRTNETLAASRDLLLPRLISGQLSVETAERELELAA